MPQRAPSPCTQPGCSATVRIGSRCPAHRQGRSGTPSYRGSATKQGYGSDWRRLRDQVKAEEPSCRLCGAPTTDIDHIVARKSGGSEARSNLRGLCHSCHARKTAEEDGGFGNTPKRRAGVAT